MHLLQHLVAVGDQRFGRRAILCTLQAGEIELQRDEQLGGRVVELPRDSPALSFLGTENLASDAASLALELVDFGEVLSADHDIASPAQLKPGEMHLVIMAGEQSAADIQTSEALPLNGAYIGEIAQYRAQALVAGIDQLPQRGRVIAADLKAQRLSQFNGVLPARIDRHDPAVAVDQRHHFRKPVDGRLEIIQARQIDNRLVRGGVGRSAVRVGSENGPMLIRRTQSVGQAPLRKPSTCMRAPFPFDIARYSKKYNLR